MNPEQSYMTNWLIEEFNRFNIVNEVQDKFLLYGILWLVKVQ